MKLPRVLLVEKSNHERKMKILIGLKALPFKIKFRLSLFKYLFNRKKFPLFLLSSSKGGLIKTIKMQRDFKQKKIVRSNNKYLMALALPQWPSKAFDHTVALGGWNFTAGGTPYKQLVNFAILAITRKCRYNCKHCYEKHNLAEEESISIQRWKEVIQDIQQTGVGIIVLSGGEPMLRYEGVLDLLENGNKDLSDFHLHTSGHGVTYEKAMRLKRAGLAAAAVGLDDVKPERQDELRGYNGAFNEALQALHYFHEAGIFTYTNVCLTKEMVRSGDLRDYYELANLHKVGIIRFLEPIPCGGYSSKSLENLFTEQDRKITEDFYLESNRNSKYRYYPMVAYQAYFERPKHLGCVIGSLTHFYIDSVGNVEPCVFLPISFGNIQDEEFSVIFFRMRDALPKPLRTDCPAKTFIRDLKGKTQKEIKFPVQYNKSFLNNFLR